MAMRKPSLAVVPSARTPERQALADAILERDRRAALVQAKSAEKADLTRQYEPIRSRQFALEDDLKFARQRTTSDIERLHALLSGESLPEVTSVEAMRAELETVTAEVERLRQQQVVIDSDLRLLENAHSMAVGWVQDAAATVVAVEPATAAVVAEYAKVKTQLRMLDRPSTGR